MWEIMQRMGHLNRQSFGLRYLKMKFPWGPRHRMDTVGIKKVTSEDKCRKLAGVTKCIAIVQQIRDLLSINLSQCKEQSCQKPTRIVELFVGSAMYLKLLCSFNIIVIFPPSTDNHIMYRMILEYDVNRHSLFRIVVFTTRICWASAIILLKKNPHWYFVRHKW